MTFLLYLYLIIFPVGRALNRPLYQSDRRIIPFAPLTAVVTLLSIIWIARELRSGFASARETPNFACVAAFAAWAFISLIYNHFRFGLDLGDTVISGLYLVRWTQYALLYFIVYELVSSRRNVQRVFRWLIVGGVAFCAFGIFQAIFLPNFALLLFPEARPGIDYDIQGHRLVSTLLDPNIAAGYILILVIIAMSFYVRREKGWFWIFLLSFLALLLTLSRGGILGFAVGSIVLWLGSRGARRRLVLGLSLLTLIALAIYPIVKPEVSQDERFAISDESAVGRIVNWILVLNMVRDNPVMGIGFNTFGYVGEDYGIKSEGGLAFGVEGDLLMILTMTGIVGLSLYLIIFKKMFGSLKHLRDESLNSWDQAFSEGVLAAFWAVLASGCFTTLLLYPEIMALMWVLWALAESLHRELSGPQTAFCVGPTQALDRAAAV